jgi:DNA-binding NarL/FixJ family response regulator
MLQQMSLILTSQNLFSHFQAHSGNSFKAVAISGPIDRAFVNQAGLTQPDAILLRFESCDQRAGLIAALRRACPLAMIIVCASSEEEKSIEKAVKAGADSYLSAERLSPAKLVETVTLICQARLSFFPRSAADLLTSCPERGTPF